MQQSAVTVIFLPLALGVIMLGLGLTLTLADFKRVVVYPRAVLVGLLCQSLLLPAVCFVIARYSGLSPEHAVGLMLLAASPGGAIANVYSHLAEGDVALNITLTAVNSLLSLFTLPFIINFALVSFMGDGRVIPLQFAKVIQVFALVLIPVSLGMTVRHYREGIAAKLARPVRILSAVLLFVIIAAAVAKQRHEVLPMLRLVGGAALAFNLASLLVGYLVPRLVRLPRKQAIAIGMEIGIHNATLAITIASTPSLLNNPAMAVPPAIYGLIMFVIAAAFGWLVSRGKPA